MLLSTGDNTTRQLQFFTKMLSLFLLLCSLQSIIGTSIPTVELSDGNKMPLVGFGTFQIEEQKFESAMDAALNNGYRHIDTAFIYYNEKLIGRNLKKWFTNGGKREELFITSKLPETAMRSTDVEEVLNLSLEALGVDYLDMYLIHKPFGFDRTSDFDYVRHGNGSAVIDMSTDLIAIWKELEKQVRAGKIKSIGLSNFNETQILRIWKTAQIKPTYLQVETNVYIQQRELHKLCQKIGIALVAYSPLGSGKIRMRRKREIELISPVYHPMVLTIAENHNKTPAQVLLRFNLQRNIAVIPKSSNPNRIKENIDIFDFALTEDEMRTLTTLDQHGKYRKFDFIPTFPGIQYHPEYPFTDAAQRQ